MKKILFFAFLSICFLTTDLGAQIKFWSQTGGPEAGTVSDISIDSLGKIILWTTGSGVLRSTDNGTSWNLINNGLPNLSMKFGAVGKSNMLFGGNQNRYKQLFRFDQNDPNAKWEEITSKIKNFLEIVDILADPDGSLYIATLKGIQRSDDNGTTWTWKNVNFIDTDFTGKRPDSSAAFLAIDGKGNIFALSTYGGVFKSSNKGDSWLRLGRHTPREEFVKSFVIAENGNILIGTFGNTTKGGLIYLSTNEGASWDSVYQRPANTAEERNHVEKLIKVPGSSVLYANAHGITLRSIDNGVTWTIQDSEKRGDEPFTMAARANNLFQMSEPDGVFLSTDNGITWTEKNGGILVYYLYGIAINSKQKLFVISEFGLHRSVDQGDTWDHAPEYGETYTPSIFIDSKDNIFIGTNRGLFKSTDDGETLAQVKIAIDTNGYNTIIQVGESPWGTYYLSSRLNTVVFALSTDNGDHWEQKVPGWPEENRGPEAFAFGVKDTMIAVTNSFYRSVNSGNTWTTTNAKIDGTKKLIIHPDGSYLALIEQTGVFRSIDGGENWARIFPYEGLENIKECYSMMVDTKGNIVVSTDSGVFHSTSQNFTTWNFVSSGLEWQANHYTNVSSVVQNPVTGVFFAASKGRSVFKSIKGLGVGSEQKSASSPIRVNAYPNPFSTSTNISFALKNRCQVNADIYDALGRNVKTLFSGFMDEGQRNLTFDGSALPSGSYLVVLRAGAETFTSWITLTK